MKKALTLLACALFTFGTTFTTLSCSSDGDSSPTTEEKEDGKTDSSTVSTTAISISSTKTEIDATGTATLTATLTPTNSTESVTWSITSGSDKAELSATSGTSVTLTGKNTTTSNATVTVKATSGSVTKTQDITVKGKFVTSDSVTLPTKKITLSLHECIGSTDTVKTSITTQNTETSKVNARILKSDLTSLKVGDYIGFTVSNVTSFRIDDTDWNTLGAILIDTTTNKLVQNPTNSSGEFIVNGSFVFALTEAMLSKIHAGTNAWNGCVEFHGTATFSDVYYLTTDSTQNLPNDPTLAENSSKNFAKKLVIGWNLGNTLDAHDSTAGKTNKGLSTETSWIGDSNLYTTEAMIKAVHAKGFETIRIPVSWHNHITKDDGEYTIDSQWMARVKTIVDWAINDGMYVILNVHHDDLTQSEMSSMYGYCVDLTESYQTTSKAYLSKVWKQIATTFASYDNHLIFEVLNEPRYRDGENNGFTAPTNLSEYNAVIKDYEETCITAIRGVSGNANRFLMVPYYAANPDAATGWSIPTDSATDKLLISVHAYSPYRFAMYDGTSHTEFTNTGDSNTADDENELKWLFGRISEKWSNVGVIIGEASASNKNNDAERLKWINSYFAKAKAAGFPVVLWDNMKKTNSDLSEAHGWFDRTNLSWYFPALVEAMINNSK